MAHFLDGTDEDRPSLAAGLMLTSLMMLAAADAMGRMAGEHISFWQFQAIRASSNVVLLLGFSCLVMGGLPRRPNNLPAVAARVLMMVLATVFFFGGIPKVSVVEMAAGLYTYPIFVTVLSVLFLGEKVGLPRIMAVLAGAAGALLILQPGGEGFDPVKLMPVGAGFSYACNVIITRRWCRGENAITMSMSIALSFMVFGFVGCLVLGQYTPPQAVRETLPYLSHGWRDAAAWVIAITLACSVLNAAANVMLTKAYQSAESSWLAPFDYTYLIFASVMGFALFGTLPGPLQVLGMALIAAGGIVTAWRERRLKAQLAEDLGTELPPPGNRA